MGALALAAAVFLSFVQLYSSGEPRTGRAQGIPVACPAVCVGPVTAPENAALGTGGQSEAAPSSAANRLNPGSSRSRELVLRGENWASYPGSLGDQVGRALEGADPEMAHFLGNRLADCVTFVAVPDALMRRNMAAGLGLSAEDERMKSLCQSVALDWQSASWSLLSLAVKGGQFGAASDMFRTAGKLSPEARVQLLADAGRGHAWSVIMLAAVAPAALGVSQDEQLLARQALLLASERVDATTRTRWTLAVQSISAQWGQSPGQTVRMPTSEGMARAEAMASSLVARARSAS